MCIKYKKQNEKLKTDISFLEKKLEEYVEKIQICGEERNSYSKTDHSATFMRIKTDYMGNLFEGSKRLLELSDCIREIPSPCICGKKATMNARYIGNKIIYSGEQIDLGSNEKYIGLCHKCWRQGFVPESFENNIFAM